MLEPENITAFTEQFDFNFTSFDYDFSNSSNSSCTNVTDKSQPQLNVPYTILESLVAFVAVIGNALVIVVFYRERRLRRRTNYYIISLAIADFLVGFFGIPFAILVSDDLMKLLLLSLYSHVRRHQSDYRKIFTHVYSRRHHWLFSAPYRYSVLLLFRLIVIG